MSTEKKYGIFSSSPRQRGMILQEVIGARSGDAAMSFAKQNHEPPLYVYELKEVGYIADASDTEVHSVRLDESPHRATREPRRRHSTADTMMLAEELLKPLGAHYEHPGVLQVEYHGLTFSFGDVDGDFGFDVTDPEGGEVETVVHGRRALNRHATAGELADFVRDSLRRTTAVRRGGSRADSKRYRIDEERGSHSAAELRAANAEDEYFTDHVLPAIARLDVGASRTFGGGAGARFKITRVA